MEQKNSSAPVLSYETPVADGRKPIRGALLICLAVFFGAAGVLMLFYGSALLLTVIQYDIPADRSSHLRELIPFALIGLVCAYAGVRWGRAGLRMSKGR